MEPERQAAPDYTAAFLVSFCTVLFCTLIFVWASMGYLAALFAGWLSDALLRRIHTRRQASAITADAASRPPEP